MAPVEPNLVVPSQQSRSKRRSRSTDRSSRTKSRRNDRESSPSSSDRERDDERDSRDDDDDDDDDDASVSSQSSRESATPKLSGGIRWDYRMNLTGRRVRESKALCCLHCRYPVVLVGRLIPCKHAAFCLQCANELKNDRRNCPKCNEAITDVDKIEAKNLILCNHGSHPHAHDACLRGYTSQRDLQAHIKRRHEQTRLDSPHQLISSTAAFPGLIGDGQQPSSLPPPPPPPQPTQLPPPLMTFPPLNAPPPPPPPPPLFDLGFRPTNYGIAQPQQFVPPQAQYRPPPYPPNRPFY